MYWVAERESIRIKKEANRDKPWTSDPIFQKTYFCNVHREDDKVTRWIRSFYSRRVGDRMFEYNIIFSRFINNVATLEDCGYLEDHNPDELLEYLEQRATDGLKVWGGAYVITTHGIPMPKARYLCDNVLGAAFRALERPGHPARGGSCTLAAEALQEIEGVGSFLAGQIVADLKNTPGHPLSKAFDKPFFVTPGPGSLRGLSWIFSGGPKGVTESNFMHYFNNLRTWVDQHWPPGVTPVDNQDLQNCLCEFDKYCRVTTGTGKSKRNYAGL